MPTYLVHGFRWHRPAIRIHIILYDLDDAAAEWIIAPASSLALLNSFYTLYDFLPPAPPRPMQLSSSGSNGFLRTSASRRSRSGSTRASTNTSRSNGTMNGSMTSGEKRQQEKGRKAQEFNNWSPVKLLEQYDADDLTASTQPYAYVADYIVDVKLSADIAGEMGAYEQRARKEQRKSRSRSGGFNGVNGSAKVDSGIEAGLAAPSAGLGESLEPPEPPPKSSPAIPWIDRLKDQLQKEEAIGWYIVHCGDEDRDDAGNDDGSVADEEEYYEEDGYSTEREIEAARKKLPTFFPESAHDFHAVPLPHRVPNMHVLPPLQRPVTASTPSRPTTASRPTTSYRPKTPNLRSVKSFFGLKTDDATYTDDHETIPDMPVLDRRLRQEFGEQRPPTATRMGSMRSSSTRDGDLKFENPRTTPAPSFVGEQRPKTPKLRSMKSFFGRKERQKALWK